MRSHFSKQVSNCFILLHHFLMMAVTLNGCPSLYFVAHEDIDLQVLPLMVSEFQPLNIVFHKLVIFLVFWRRPVVVWIFSLLSIMKFVRTYRWASWTLSFSILELFHVFFLHLVLWVVRTVAASIGAGLISGSLGNDLLVLSLIAHEDLVIVRVWLEWAILRGIEICILRKGLLTGKGIISVVLIKLLV